MLNVFARRFAQAAVFMHWLKKPYKFASPALWFIVVGALIHGCSAIPKYDYVVLSANELEASWHSRLLWNPSDAQVERALSGIRQYLDSWSKTQRDSAHARFVSEAILQSLPTEKVQCIGIYKNLIHLNFFPYNSGWRKKYITIQDGGFCVWGIDFNCDTGRYSNFQHSGFA